MTTDTVGDLDLSGRGTYLRTCVLLLLAGGPAHGYELQTQLPARGFGRVDSGGLYRALRVMEEEGYVASYWENNHAGPARRVYAITDDGLSWLHESAGTVRATRRRLSRLLRHYRDVADRISTHAP